MTLVLPHRSPATTVSASLRPLSRGLAVTRAFAAALLRLLAKIPAAIGRAYGQAYLALSPDVKTQRDFADTPERW